MFGLQDDSHEEAFLTHRNNSNTHSKFQDRADKLMKLNTFVKLWGMYCASLVLPVLLRSYLILCLVAVCTNFPYSFLDGWRDREGDEGPKWAEKAIQVVETVKVLGWWESNYWPKTTILCSGFDEFIWFLLIFILHMSDARVMLICFVHAKHTEDLGIFVIGSWDLETVALRSMIGAVGAQLQRNWESLPTGFISVNLTMEKAGKECRDAFNYTTSPLSCCPSTSFAKERTTLAIQHSHIRRTIGCLIWELRKCSILLLRKQDSFEPLSLLYKLWWNLLMVFYSKFLWCTCLLKLQHSPCHFARKSGDVFSQLNHVDFLKGMSLSPHNSSETYQNSINFETFWVGNIPTQPEMIFQPRWQQHIDQELWHEDLLRCMVWYISRNFFQCHCVMYWK